MARPMPLPEFEDGAGAQGQDIVEGHAALADLDDDRHAQPEDGMEFGGHHEDYRLTERRRPQISRKQPQMMKKIEEGNGGGSYPQITQIKRLGPSRLS